ncbi:MAG: cytochrome c biogenesis protein CcdA [Verrucomicrobiales bacterium]|nr:cytochrome c biogenesis protein CcdA [Verrucomicrobiales bacterium]
MRRTPSLFLILFLLCATAHAQIPFGLGGPSNISLTLRSDRPTAAPGDTVAIVLKMDHNPGWNSYWLNPGTGMPTTLNWTVPEGYKTGETLWPIPKVKPSDLGTSHVYIDDIYIVTPLKIPENATPGEVEIALAADWLECDKQGCVPKGGEATLTLKIAEKAVGDPEVKTFAKKVIEQQPAHLDSWQVELGGNDEVFEARLTPGAGANTAPGEIYFFESSESPALEYELPEVTRDGGTFVLKMKKSESVPSANIEGFFYAPNGWEEGDDKTKALAVGSPSVATTTAPIPPAEPVETDSETDHSVTGAAEGEIAAGAALYDVNAKPNYVLLSGAEEKKLTLLPALGLVFIGGLLLNLMPCVFPVLGLKIMGFVSQAGEEEHKVKKHGMVFGLGVLISMWVLSGIIIALGLNWGAQLTNPVFVAGIVILLFVMGLNMAGVFEFGTSMVSVGGDLQNKKGYSGSFFSGVLTTLIATPCSGPFLGSVMGFALSQKAPIAFLVFTFFAMGIASPYVVLAFFPRAINRLPQPGAWMEHFKKGMSFALFATAVFFLGSFGKQTGYDGLSWMLFALVMIGFATWIYGTWGSPFVKKSRRYFVGYGLALVAGLLGFQMVRVAVNKEAPALAAAEDVGEWKQWFPGSMELARKKKRIAWIDYTADW